MLLQVLIRAQHVFGESSPGSTLLVYGMHSRRPPPPPPKLFLSDGAFFARGGDGEDASPGGKRKSPVVVAPVAAVAAAAPQQHNSGGMWIVSFLSLYVMASADGLIKTFNLPLASVESQHVWSDRRRFRRPRHPGGCLCFYGLGAAEEALLPPDETPLVAGESAFVLLSGAATECLHTGWYQCLILLHPADQYRTVVDAEGAQFPLLPSPPAAAAPKPASSRTRRTTGAVAIIAEPPKRISAAEVLMMAAVPARAHAPAVVVPDGAVLSCLDEEGRAAREEDWIDCGGDGGLNAWDGEELLDNLFDVDFSELLTGPPRRLEGGEVEDLQFRLSPLSGLRCCSSPPPAPDAGEADETTSGEEEEEDNNGGVPAEYADFF